jgi:malto-oligosyltrehalose trehalohydrolase
MPFGAELTDGGARFRLWAPSAEQVELVLNRDGRDESQRLTRQDDGWYEGAADTASGTHYRYRIDGGLLVPDPASRFQPEDVHGPSELIAPRAWQWSDGGWRGRPWEEAVVYELHVGSFTREGTYAGVQGRLDYLKNLGVTAIELMPLADFPGKRNWGYDGVLPFAPDSRYGRPEDLKALVQTAHRNGLMVFLDVVYNHFGPEGNYLSSYAAPFFTERHHTPWGAAINFDGEGARTVRDYYVHNALYWLEEYRFDGLRFDAVHAIIDDSEPDILTEIAAAVARGPGRERLVHLALENDLNESRYLARDTTGRPQIYTAQWNDDIHHALHVTATGESGGYYLDYADAPLERLGRCLAEGFAYQGDPSAFRDGEPRGEPSRELPPTAFVNFLQNHDQIGNRAFGERITDLADPARVRALSAVFLMAPGVPLLFMGEEWAARQPFPFFCDFGPELAQAVTEGRRREFAKFPAFSDPQARSRIPDPNDPATFEQAVLDWEAMADPGHAEWLAWHRELLAVRAREIVPRLARLRPGAARYRLLEDRGLHVEWPLSDGTSLVLCANLSGEPLASDACPGGHEIYPQSETDDGAMSGRFLGPWSVAWFIQPASR